MQSSNIQKMKGSPSTKNTLNTNVQQIIDNSEGVVVFETAPDNNLNNDDIERGDGIMIDTGSKKPHTGGGMYLIKFSDGYKKLCRLMLLPNNQYFIRAVDHPCIRLRLIELIKIISSHFYLNYNYCVSVRFILPNIYLLFQESVHLLYFIVMLMLLLLLKPLELTLYL